MMKKLKIIPIITIVLLITTILVAGCVQQNDNEPYFDSPLPLSFVGKWHLSLTLGAYDIYLNFPNEKDFTITMNVKDGDLFNEMFSAEGIFYETGDVIIEKGYLEKTTNGKYNLLATYCWIKDKNGDTVIEGEIDPQLIGIMQYDNTKDKLIYENASFKREL